MENTTEQIGNAKLLYKALQERIDETTGGLIYHSDYVDGLRFARRLMAEVFFPEVNETKCDNP